MGHTVWKSDAGRVRLESWYDRFLARVPVPVERRTITTSAGPGDVLLAGPAGAPVVVCLHAMRTGAAHFLSELGPLAERFRLVAPDLPAQSVRGPQTRLSLKDDSHARWLVEVLDALGVGVVNLFGVSWGGFVARQTATAFPARVRRLALLVPAGVVNGSHWKGLTRMAVPLLRYRLRPTGANLRRLLDPLLTTWDDLWAGYTGDSMRDLTLDLRVPPLATDAELRGLTAPTLVLAAADDISFPGAALVERVKRLVPSVDAAVIAGSKHCPPTTPEFRAWLAARVGAFFGPDAG
ncbi:MAG TPA: alpha/beta hydrolase [Urbifossiella sp.]|nr:alpha/beta hydrolase [Urbifossiella sp.]